MSNPIGDILDLSMENIRKIADANTVVGQPILCEDGMTVIPISRVKMGFAGGGSEFSPKGGASVPYGAGSGAGVSVTPIAFLVAKDGACRVLPIPEPAANSVDRLIELVPDLADRVLNLIDERKSKED